ncbi:MAG TPA: MBL fold metallo-hydrolase [Opitutaceae bacterium]|nr:MBL fold metallo-hydrolase [Opitutaceae bacterium]
MNRLPLEDNFTDVIGKAQRGLGISDSALAKLSGIDVDSIRQLKSGKVDGDALAKIAPHLRLDTNTLITMAHGEWYPEVPEFPDGFEMFTTLYGDMTVNSYLVWDAASGDAVAFDTGASCDGMLSVVTRRSLNIRLIVLTHTHEDHIEDLPRLRNSTGAPLHLSNRGAFPGAKPLAEGDVLKLGSLRIRTLHTYGHADDGSTFVIDGLALKLAIAGDSLFASSMGGSATNYEDGYRNNIEKIFTLPDDTVLATGHGPLTTVGQERLHNPFFAAKFA